MATINCIGVAVMDALSGPLREYPSRRQRVQVVTDSVAFIPGGGAVNVASTLAQLGHEVALFTKVGDDANGREVVSALSAVGVDTSCVRVSAGDSTPFTFVGVHEDGERTFIHTPGANRTFGVGDIEKETLLDCNYLVYMDLWVQPMLDGDAGAQILREARGRGVVTLLDECWGLGPDRAVLEQMVSHADYVLPSLDEVGTLYPGLSKSAVADHLLGLGAGTVVLKMGTEGCFVRTADAAEQVPVVPAEAVDTTGAGDSFNAGFIAGLVRGLPPVDAAKLGVQVASRRIGVIGGSTPIPTEGILP
jgi:sugar/nucleoside kinase (ribokinase family)